MKMRRVLTTEICNQEYQRARRKRRRIRQKFK
jgi:hypothetical protein